MKHLTIKNGFIAAALANILGVLTFSRLFTNEVLNQAAPVVMSNFGLLIIILWGFAYLSVASTYKNVPWLIALFAVEKLVYGLAWIIWFVDIDLASVYKNDIMAGIFYSIYGINDLLFMAFFAWVFLKIRRVG